MKTFLTLCLVAAFTALSSLQATPADPPAEKKPEKSAPPQKFRPFNGTIKSIDATARTITLKGEKAQTFAVTSETKINKDGKPVAFEDLAVEDKVGGRAKETAEGNWTALTINAGKRPAAKPEDKGKK
jgi:Cu/Ag efflux protein CusF